MKWWENVIDGNSLENHNHEMNNGFIAASSFADLEENFKAAVPSGELFGISFNPPQKKNRFSGDNDMGAVCYYFGGDVWWVHINLISLSAWLGREGRSDIEERWFKRGEFKEKADGGSKMNPETKSDEVSNPSHYCEGRTYEPKDVIRDWNLNFNLGNVVKYISRNGRKAGESKVKDLRKARQYLDFEIEALEKECADSNTIRG